MKNKKALILLVVMLSGCTTLWKDIYDKLTPVIIDNPEKIEETQENEFPEGLIWLGTNVSSWDKTANLKEVRIDSRLIQMPYDKSNEWPAREIGGLQLNANPWIIANVNGKWYAATWEWLRYGQTTKSTYAVAGDHIKRKEFGDDWKPKAGETYGFFISGLVRSHVRNVQQRSNVIYVVWPNIPHSREINYDSLVNLLD
jgi:hypothetical protein